MRIMRFCKGRTNKNAVGIITLVTLLALHYLPVSVQASAYQHWGGVWLTNHGEMTLKQDGKIVSGTYLVNNELVGRIEGMIQDEWGYILRGKYRQGTDSGFFEFRIVDSNKSFRGWLDSRDFVCTGVRIRGLYGEMTQKEIALINNSPYHITALFICPANSEDWREVLGGAELGCGQQRWVIFDMDDSICVWDIKVVDSSGCFTVFRDQQIKPEHTSINYYYKAGSGRIQFAVG